MMFTIIAIVTITTTLIISLMLKIPCEEHPLPKRTHPTARVPRLYFQVNWSLIMMVIMMIQMRAMLIMMMTLS